MTASQPSPHISDILDGMTTEASGAPFGTGSREPSPDGLGPTGFDPSREIIVEKDAIARWLGPVLPGDIDWQHIRFASQAFVAALDALRRSDKQTEMRIVRLPMGVNPVRHAEFCDDRRVENNSTIANTVYDKTGREIKLGDVLKVYHFTGARWRKRYFMYKQVVGEQVWPNGDVCWSLNHLEMKDGDGYYLARDGKVLSGYEIVQSATDDFHNRPRVRRDSDGSPKGGDACGSVHDSAGRQASPNPEHREASSKARTDGGES